MLGRSNGPARSGASWSSRPPVLPRLRRRGRSRSSPPDGSVESGTEVADFIDSRVRRPARRVGLDDGRGPLRARSSATPTGDPPARRDPARRRPDRRHAATATAAAPPATWAPGTLTALRSTIPYVAAGREPAGRHGRRRRRDGRQRQAPRARRRCAPGRGRSPCPTSSGSTRRPIPPIARVRCLPPVEPGKPIRHPARARRRAPRRSCCSSTTSPCPTRWCDACVASPRRAARCSASTIEIGTPYYQGVTVAALVAARPGRPASSSCASGPSTALYRLHQPARRWPRRRRLAVRRRPQRGRRCSSCSRPSRASSASTRCCSSSTTCATTSAVGFGSELVKLGSATRCSCPPTTRWSCDEAQPMRRKDWLVHQLPVGMVEDQFLVRFLSHLPGRGGHGRAADRQTAAHVRRRGRARRDGPPARAGGSASTGSTRRCPTPLQREIVRDATPCCCSGGARRRGRAPAARADQRLRRPEPVSRTTAACTSRARPPTCRPTCASRRRAAGGPTEHDLVRILRERAARRVSRSTCGSAAAWCGPSRPLPAGAERCPSRRRDGSHGRCPQREEGA